MLTDGREGSLGDKTALNDDVGFTPRSGHPAGGVECPLSAVVSTGRRNTYLEQKR
jgi:hypothetical protein